MPATGNTDEARSGVLGAEVEGSAMLDVAGAARYLGVTVAFVRRLVLERRVRYFKLGKFVRFRPADLDALVEAAARAGDAVRSHAVNTTARKQRGLRRRRRTQGQAGPPLMPDQMKTGRASGHAAYVHDVPRTTADSPPRRSKGLERATGPRGRTTLVSGGTARLATTSEADHSSSRDRCTSGGLSMRWSFPLHGPTR